MQTVNVCYQAASDTLGYLKKFGGKKRKKKQKPQHTLFLKIDARHMPASRALTFHILAFLHCISSDYSIPQPYFPKVNNFHPDLASSCLHYIFILLECPLGPIGEGFKNKKKRDLSQSLSCLSKAGY